MISEVKKIGKETRGVLNEYLLSLKLENKAEATIDKYRRILEGLLSECAIPLKDITSESVRKWLGKFSKNKMEKTLDLILAVLSSFFQFCLDEKYECSRYKNF